MELARIAARHCPTVTVEAPEVFTIRLGRRTLWIVKTTTRQSHRTDGIGACQSTEIIRLKALRIMIVIYKLPRPVVHGPTEVYPDEHTHLAIVALRQAMPWRRPAQRMSLKVPKVATNISSDPHSPDPSDPLESLELAIRIALLIPPKPFFQKATNGSNTESTRPANCHFHCFDRCEST